MEKRLKSQTGITLIEVMVALVVVSVSVSLISQYVAGGMTKPFIVYQPEPWLVYMDETRKVIEGGGDSVQISRLSAPSNLKEWQLKWETHIPSQLKSARFTAVDIQDNTYSWRVFVLIDEG